MQTDIHYILPTIAGLLMALFSLLWFRFRATGEGVQGLQPSGQTNPAHIRNLGRFFHERVSHFKGQIQTLDDHSNEYTSIFSGDDWSQLMHTIAQLEEADSRIQGLIVRREFELAYKVLEEFYDPRKHQLDSVQANIDSIKASAAWESQVRSMLKRVVCNLETATSEVKELSDPKRSRKRQPTLVTLADVKKSLLEDEAFAREQG